MNNRRNILSNFEKYGFMVEDKLNSTIESTRKGLCNIIVKDENGEPVSDAVVKVKQTKHAFRIGANIFMLDEFKENEAWKNDAYKKLFADTFNMATLPFYWDALEPQKGHTRYGKDSEKIFRRPAPDLCLEFCEKNGIEPREHALAYTMMFPDWLRDKSIPEVKYELERRFSEISERYANRINTIEVTNELQKPKFAIRSEFHKDPDFIRYCFALAEKYFPSNQLVINEAVEYIFDNSYPYTRPYFLEIENALGRGARIDAIGMQFHSFFRAEDEEKQLLNTRYNPRELYEVFDTYDYFKKPLQITEVTIPAYTESDEDEQIQADIMENLIKVWFSVPSIEQIIYWNLVDGYAAFAPLGDMTAGENYYRGGLVRFDMTPKPAYYRIKELFEKVWHTECDAVPLPVGGYGFKGFYGDYDVEITANGKTVTKQIKLEKEIGGLRQIEIKL